MADTRDRRDRLHPICSERSHNSKEGSPCFGVRKPGDWAGEIRFSSGIGTGLALGGFEQMGMPYLDNTIELAEQHPESGYPYMAVAGKAMALIQKGDYDKAGSYAIRAKRTR